MRSSAFHVTACSATPHDDVDPSKKLINHHNRAPAYHQQRCPPNNCRRPTNNHNHHNNHNNHPNRNTNKSYNNHNNHRNNHHRHHYHRQPLNKQQQPLGSIDKPCRPVDGYHNYVDRRDQRRALNASLSVRSASTLSSSSSPSLQDEESTSSDATSPPSPLQLTHQSLPTFVKLFQQQLQQQQQLAQPQHISVAGPTTLLLASTPTDRSSDYESAISSPEGLDRLSDLTDSHPRPKTPPTPQAPPPPPPRQWVSLQANQLHSDMRSSHQTIQHQTHTRQISNNDAQRPEFTVVTYNVLCDRMVSEDKFPSSPNLSLDWSYRRQLILKQLLTLDADVIALQELEMEQFESFFKPVLNRLGSYEALFGPKSRIKTMDPVRRARVDGCAIFFKSNRFKLIEQHLLEYNQIALANSNGNEAMLNRVMPRDNVGLAAILELITPPSGQPLVGGHKARNAYIAPTSSEQAPQILVCNTHIHWDPEQSDVKIIQTIMLMNELQAIARNHLTKQHNKTGASMQPDEMIISKSLDDLPLVLLGDFNSLPNSGVALYLNAGKISSSHHEFRSFHYTELARTLADRAPVTRSNSAPTGAANDNRQWPQNSSHHTNKCNKMRRSSEIMVPQPVEPSRGRPAARSANENRNTNNNNNYRRLSQPHAALTPDLSPRKSSPIAASAATGPASYQHPFQLASAYPPGTIPYTNYTPTFKATIDYIFYSKNSLDTIAHLGPLDSDWLRTNQINGLPQPYLPSDHLPLVARLRFRPRAEPRAVHQQPGPKQQSGATGSRSWYPRGGGAAGSGARAAPASRPRTTRSGWRLERQGAFC